MSSRADLFHESWYRIADQKISLRFSVKSDRQWYRGKKWHILQDPFNNQFYRLPPAAYEFVSRLSTSRTVDEVWKETIERNPDEAPGQGEVIDILAQLYQANLLHYDISDDSAKLFERQQKKKQRKLKANFSNIMFLRIPLFDPSQILKKMNWANKIVLSYFGLAIWLLVVGLGIKLAMDNWAALGEQTQGILAPANLFYLYISLVIIKTIHEFGHAFAVHRFGGEVHTIGIMFLLFNPIPYVDAGASWAFRNKWKRAFVGAAGMIFEVFVAAIALFIWTVTGEGIVHSLAYNMIFIASVSTLLFNINPLLRFDGYYILTDVLEFPNLHQQSSAHLTHLVEHYAFHCKHSETPAATAKEAFWLTTFGICSGIYKFIIFAGILMFVADQFLLAGIIMFVLCVIKWGIAPIIKLIKYLGSSPKLARVRARAIGVTGGTAAMVFLLLYSVPFPYSFKAPGVIKAVDFAIVVNPSEGNLKHILTASTKTVAPGEPLLKLENPDLEQKIAMTRASLSETRALKRQALFDRQADLKPIEHREGYLNQRLSRLEKEKENLTVRAAIGGTWSSPELEENQGMWFSRGTPFGQLIGPGGYHFICVVSQEDVSLLFDANVRGATVRLAGQSGIDIPVKNYKTIPMEQTKLPSTALGWSGGGEIAVDASDKEGTRTTEPFYEVRARVYENTTALLRQNRSGKIKFSLNPMPLLPQWYRKIRQLVQKRYHI